MLPKVGSYLHLLWNGLTKFALVAWLLAKEIIAPLAASEAAATSSNVLKRRNENIDLTTEPNKSRKPFAAAGPSTGPIYIKIEDSDEDLLDPVEFQALRALQVSHQSKSSRRMCADCR